MKSSKRLIIASIFAILAACFYAVNIPLSKLIITQSEPTFTAAFLYLGAGVGVGIMYLLRYKNESKTERLTKSDLPYTVGMVALDIIAPIMLMMGISIGTAANASLLNNFEIVATSVIAFILFKETISPKLWLAIAMITAASIIISFEGAGSLDFSFGSILVIGATVCWGFENNCTRRLADKSTYQIVVVKGVFSGLGSAVIAFAIHETLPSLATIVMTMLLGFVSYGLSIFLYIRAQRDLGAAKTSAYYAMSPFVGAALSFVINGESVGVWYFVALAIMIVAVLILMIDLLKSEYKTIDK